MLKRKDAVTHSPSHNRRTKKEKVGDFSDDEDLSDLEDGDVFNGIRIPAELPPIVSAEENSGPRMVIKNIVANNFKSYYGQVTIGPFHKSLTSIVGANGSGKSNVIDSLLFVFGYRSTKIRSKKVSVLLHKSDKHKDVHQCSVTVNFVLIHDDDNVETGFTSIPGTEITITRTAFKDNTSFYTLNKKRVKFKEIANVLKKNGIDLIHNRFLILQGEVEQIAMMKPKAENDHSTGMLEYLEDVIGTVRYKKPIKNLEEKLNELSLEKNEKITRLKFYAKERDDLLEPVQDVVRYLKLDNKAIQLQNKLFQKNIREVNKKIDIESENEIEIEEKLRLIKDELEEIKKSKKEKERLIRRLNEQLKVDGDKKENFDKQIKLLTNEENNLKACITRMENEITKLEGTIKQEKNKINKNKRLPETKEVERKHLQSQLVPLEEECTKLELIYNKIYKNGFEKSKKFREEKDLLVPEEIRLEAFVSEKEHNFKALKVKLDILDEKEQSHKNKLINLEKQMTTEIDMFLDTTRKKKEAEEEVRKCKCVIVDLEKDLENLKKDEDQIKIKLQNIRHSLSEKRTAYAETTERSRPIQFIINLKEKKEIPGILGRCGDYGQVEGKYDIPACTACGSTDQVVVEYTVAANECIKRLRQSNAGRLTFSILPEIQRYKSRADANNNYPENAKRVFDLIQILDERFRLTFYAGLFDTLLADDLEQARRIAFGTQTRYRVVTFKGDLIDQSGLMSGGGRPIKGKIGPQETRAKYGNNNSQVTQNDVEKLDKIAKGLEIQLKETQSKINECQNNIESNRKRINNELNIIVKECLVHMNSWKKKEINLKNMIKDQKLLINENKTDPIVFANEEKALKEAAKELEDAKVEFNKVKSKVDGLEKKIEEITQEEPREAKHLFDEASENLQRTRREINKIDFDIEVAAKKISLSEKKIETQKTSINEFKESIESKKNDLKINHESLEKLKEEFDELKVNLVEQKKKLEESKNTNDENNHRQNELLVEEMNLKEDIGKVKQNLEQLKGRWKQFKDVLSKLKLHEIPEIDVIHRDPVMESYQNRNTKGQITATLDAVNDKEKCEKDDQNWIQVDENKDEDKDNNLDSKELPIYTNEQLDEETETNITMLRNSIEESMKDLKPNMNILNEYKKRVQQYNEKADEVAEVLKIYNDHADMINKVRQRRRDEFMASFKKITIKLKEMYQMITLGGDAELELVDSLDPFSEGVNFSVRPPKKTWKVISNLSGGEKTLSSLALVFALHYYKPSPLYVMDEIDAALDFKNVSIISYYIKERTKNSQFIIISLRSNMFEKADLLVGIYKTNDCTDTASVRTKDYGSILEGALAMYFKIKEAK